MEKENCMDCNTNIYIVGCIFYVYGYGTERIKWAWAQKKKKKKEIVHTLYKIYKAKKKY